MRKLLGIKIYICINFNTTTNMSQSTSIKYDTEATVPFNFHFGPFTNLPLVIHDYSVNEREKVCNSQSFVQDPVVY